MSAAYNRSSILALVESTRQRLGFKGDQTPPTPNVRNPQMLQEAEAFAPHLRAFEKAVREYHRHVQGFVRSLIPLLDENLPRVWTAVSGGLAEPVRPAISHGHPSRVGGDFNAGYILERLDLLSRGMEEDILAPLRRWQEGLAVAQERMRSLENLRGDVDKQRRSAEKKFRNHERKLRRAYLGAGYGSSSSSSDEEFDDRDRLVPRGRLLEDYQRLALHTERQLKAIMASYEDQERLVWEQLSGLVTDAAWLESYAAAAMLKVKETMQAVALALGPSKQPLPAFRHSPYVFEGTYGEVGLNVDIIRQMAPRAIELAEGAVPRGATVLPYQPLRAKRGTATPLLVAAAARPGRQQQQLAAQPVPPVQVGAASIPLEAVPEGFRERAISSTEAQAAGRGTRVADVPSLPPALDVSAPVGGELSTAAIAAESAAAGATSTGRTLAPLTPTPKSALATTTSPGIAAASPAAAASSSRYSTSVAVPSSAAATTATTGAVRGPGVLDRGAEAVGAAVGGVRRGVASATESYQIGKAEGEAAGVRDVERAAERVEVGRERIAEAADRVTPSFGHTTDVTATTGARGADVVGSRGSYEQPAASAVAVGTPVYRESERQVSAGGVAGVERSVGATRAAGAGAAGVGGVRTVEAGAGDLLDSFVTPVKAAEPVVGSGVVTTGTEGVRAAGAGVGGATLRGAGAGPLSSRAGGVTAAGAGTIDNVDEDHFVDARSEMSTRTNSFSSDFEPSRGTAAAAAPATLPMHKLPTAAVAEAPAGASETGRGVASSGLKGAILAAAGDESGQVNGMEGVGAAGLRGQQQEREMRSVERAVGV